ncbi:TPA: 30S ribosomal protein S10 [candidate division WWE3 bacterium]|uniref:Small ribosomal subunit protein uS10 n=5 Tax=Katanobacteria TaxID=422282 RepID=A0A0G1MW32_UNCKA|nr:MAG: 30S ribosomal protein S10 [candidate division WWE3 bacterium GW2011_GWA2_44_16]KKT70140.1 MAG: 30S ribosomal protein S10 [candidate division WWE3 bacterium GW2011_GWB1_44_4]KKT84997.1 MAG: 30S ribosomal protein S10 [candidate division WWE3 bacterium GW2011_GWC2_44_9]OGC52230.1 MAG: 30S ribosomal protein S10 [candidate division WWE3 bacterium RIFCSPHIGHO2_01_FULL_43_9]HAZ29319.1 30S ribosomal protein S10 [candidate division WWE3 bacterium]
MAVKDKKESRIKIKLNAYDHRIIDLSCSKIVDVAVRTGARAIGPVPLPTRIEKYTVIRGPHIDKRSREQFEMRTHKRLLEVVSPTPATIDALSHLSLPAGVGISIKI